MTYRLGCPIWANREWVGQYFDDARDLLSQYASVFTTVEGNNTFYGLPAAATVARWRERTPPGFHFCFKFPRAISHDARLVHADAATREFLHRLTPLRDRLGPLFLQLPPSFSGAALDRLTAYLDQLPGDFDYAVEPRHRDFFTKGEHERRLNRALAERGIDRVVLDSRALFSAPAADSDTAGAQRKKPRLPTRAVALGLRPMVRFIGHPDVAANDAFLTPWLNKLALWIEQGRSPYFFAHTPNNRLAPALAALLHRRLAATITLPPLPDWPRRGAPLTPAGRSARSVRSAQSELF